MAILLHGSNQEKTTIHKERSEIGDPNTGLTCDFLMVGNAMLNMTGDRHNRLITPLNHGMPNIDVQDTVFFHVQMNHV